MKNAYKNTREGTILNSINEGVFTVDLSLRITGFNKAAEKFTGVENDEAVGLQCRDVFRADICETDCPLKHTPASVKTVVNKIAYVKNDAGERIPISISTAPLKNDSGKIMGGVVTFRDITRIMQLRKEIESRYSFEDIIGKSESMKNLFKILPRIAESDSTVLIEGESGTGKELFARAIHNLSHREGKPFTTINCGALPDTLLESELFGYEAGAFTDARKRKPGRFAAADGGTLFLDEIGDISPAMQVRLLRVLQERSYEPLGSVKTVKTNIRIVAATNKDIVQLVKDGTFREDLFYRIRVVHLKLPELKEKREDIPLLIDHLISKFNGLKNKNIQGVSNTVSERLMEYDFPGNVRELENIIEHAFVLCNGALIDLEHLPAEFRSRKGGFVKGLNNVMSIKEMEKLMICKALNKHGGNRKLSAGELGIDTSTLYRKIRRYGLEEYYGPVSDAD